MSPFFVYSALEMQMKKKNMFLKKKNLDKKEIFFF